MQTLIKAKGLVDVHKEVMVQGASVLIDQGKIIATGDENEMPEVHPEAELIDISEKYILPGLVNSHLHLCIAAEPGLGLYSEYTDYIKDFALLNAARNSQKELMSGVTTVRDCGGWNMPALRLAGELGLYEGARLFHSCRVITMTGGHGRDFGKEADGVDGVIKAVRTNLKEGADFIKLMATGGGTPNTFPGRASYSVSEIKAATETAHRIDKKVTVHARGIAGMKNAIKGDVDHIEHACFELPGGGCKYDPKIAEEIANAGIYVTPTIQLYRDGLRKLTRMKEEGTLLPEQEKRLERLPQVLDEKFVALNGFLELGVKCMAGNDAGIPGLEFGSLWGELDSMVEAGMTPMQAIVAATENTAEAMDMSNEIGSINAGKQADIIAVDGDPTRKISALEKVSFVMKGGKVIKHV